MKGNPQTPYFYDSGIYYQAMTMVSLKLHQIFPFILLIFTRSSITYVIHHSNAMKRLPFHLVQFHIYLNRNIFRHLKLEIALAIPASNDEKLNKNNSAGQRLTLTVRGPTLGNCMSKPSFK